VAVEVHRGLPDPMADSKVDTVAETAVDTIVLDFSDRFDAVKPRHGAMVHLAAERPAATMQLAAGGHGAPGGPAAGGAQDPRHTGRRTRLCPLY